MFHEFVKDFKAGHLDANLSNKLHDLVDAVQRNQAMGKLTIEVKLTPKGEGEMQTSVKYKLDAPERNTLESIMFATPENNLITSNPKQPEMFAPIREPEAAPQIVKNMSA